MTSQNSASPQPSSPDAPMEPTGPVEPAENIRTRPTLEGLPAYVPGRPPADDGIHRFKVSSNESPFPPLPAVREAVLEQIDGLNRYPDMGALALREALAAEHGVAPAQIAVSTGSVAVTGDLVRAVVDAGDDVVFPWRSFEAYPILVGSHGGRGVQVPLTSAHAVDLDAMVAAVTDRTRLMLVCTPNNPTGPALTTAQLEDLLARVPDHVVVAIDEAYREFMEPEAVPETARLFAEHGNVVLLRTFSKIHGIAGLRMGHAVAHPRLARALAQVTMPFGASTLAQAAALACLQPEPRTELESRAAQIRAERHRVIDALRRRGWDVPDSQGNFVFLDLGERGAEFGAFADARGLVVRVYGADGVRVTIAETEANDRLLHIAEEWDALSAR